MVIGYHFCQRRHIIIFLSLFTEIFVLFLNNSRFRNDFLGYIDYLEENARGDLSRSLKSFKKSISKKKELKLKYILSLTYAIRNNYVHGPDAAKSGVKRYRTKILLFKILHDFILIFLAIVGEKVIE